MSQPLQEPIQFGKYTLYERIGRGGMADVFKGRIQGPGGFERIFVVKRILPNLSDDPVFIKMFVDEAKMSARLNHPNIVQIFELGSVEEEFFISMEYVQGHDLSETMRALWKTSGAPRPDLVAYVGREICRALDYAHGFTDDEGTLLGMIHRDVSPSNVMLSFEGAVKLLDFGIAKALGDTPEVSKTGSLKGKYAYMAPEQTEGDEVDHRIDIFAAGIVLHEVLTGRRLFKGANDMQTIERVRRCEVRPPSQQNPACPPGLDAILLRALSRNRDDRFQNAGEMADALDEIVHAAHFTPQHMATILRATFGEGGGAGTGGDGRLGLTTTNSSLSSATASPSSSAGRSATVPPIAISHPRTATRPAGMAALVPDAATLDAILPRPLWKRGSFWVVSTLCAVGIGIAVAKGVGSNGRSPTGQQGTSGASTGALAPIKVRRVSVLIQTDPEGAEIFVAGKLESLGATPLWVPLEVAPQNPTRVMLRKVGFQDKAIAIEAERPPTVKLIPIEPLPAETHEQDVDDVAVTPTGEPPVEGTGEVRKAVRKRARRSPAWRVRTDEGRPKAEENPIDSP